MLSRSAATAAVGRSSAMRRQRRRTANANGNPSRYFCATNGCASFLVLDEANRTAKCPICDFTRRVH